MNCQSGFLGTSVILFFDMLILNLDKNFVMFLPYLFCQSSCGQEVYKMLVNDAAGFETQVENCLHIITRAAVRWVLLVTL